MIIVIIFTAMMFGMCLAGFLLAQSGSLSNNKFTLNSGIGIISLSVFGFVIMPIVNAVQEYLAIIRRNKLDKLQEVVIKT
jgi:hypothetical protein